MGVFQQGYWSKRQLTQSSTRSPSPEVGRQETDIPSCRQVRSRWALGVRAEGHIPGGCRAMAGVTTPGPFVVTKHCYPARAGCWTCIGANIVALESTSFEERKCFIVRSTSKETGGTAQIRLPAPGIRAKFKGFR